MKIEIKRIGNRSKSKRITWRKEITGSLTAVWPTGVEWTFSRPGKSYVFCDFGAANKPGTLGRQICYGGSTYGSTVSETTDQDFEKAVKKWVADWRRKVADEWDLEELIGN